MPSRSDPRWPPATELLGAAVPAGRAAAGLLGVPTYASSVTPRSSASTPQAVRAALARYSTYSWLDRVDLLDVVGAVDYGDVDEPDGPDGRERVAKAVAGVDPACQLLLALGGDNSATLSVLSSLAGAGLDAWGLVTLDAHLDLRDGHSNGSPVRELLAEGLDGRHVVQIGLADFANSADYARDAMDAGITVVPRCALRERSMADAVAEALEVAGAGDRPVYVDVDLDVVDRAAVPGCPAAAPGGLSADEVRVAVRLLAADPRVRAIDVTEVDVGRDADDQRTVRLAAVTVLEALAGLGEAAPVTVTLDGTPIDVEAVVAVARDGAPVVLAPAILARLDAWRAGIDEIVTSGQPVYGVSTGFGSLATTYVAPEDRVSLQQSLIRSHAAGTGDEVETEVVRAMMLCRLKTMCSGVTGVRSSTAAAYAGLLNAGLTPVVYEFGSLGCSGDLAPLAHVGLALMGEGDVRDADGERRPARGALHDAGLEPVQLAEKEGLALINGTDGMLGMLTLAVHDVAELLRVADVTASVSIQALRGTDRVFQDDLIRLRPHPGQRQSAHNLVRLLTDSPIVADHLDDDTQVQDAYSLRCAPQVHGAARDTVAHARAVAAVELASAIDNPVLLPDGTLSSNGNFHGAPLAYVLDFCAIALADVASMAERRTDRLLDPSRSFGLPAFLAHRPGVDSGLMIAHYTQAALVAELKRLASPASVDSIPTSAMQEDHVSMGWHAARKLRRAIDALRQVLAIELLCGTRAMSLRAPLRGSPPTEALVAAMAARGITPGPDRFVAPDVAAATVFLHDGSWWSSIAAHVPDLG